MQPWVGNQRQTGKPENVSTRLRARRETCSRNKSCDVNLSARQDDIRCLRELVLFCMYSIKFGFSGPDAYDFYLHIHFFI